MQNQEFFMNRCLELATKGLENVSPNPMVGSVIVYENKIIGEGYHMEYGKEHAEVNAITSVKNQKLLTKATIYVNLEPCSHFGKTPPCSDLIIAHKIPRVVIGAIDDHEKVAGKGVQKLEKAGVKVDEHGFIDVDKQRFYKFHNSKRPFVILKWAETKDGFVYQKNWCY